MTRPQLASVLGKIPSGLYVLTIRWQDQETGVLTSWVMQAGFEPPMITIALRKDRFVNVWLEAGATFVLNLLSQTQRGLVAHFGRGFEPGEPAFDGLKFHRNELGIPLLADAAGYLECRAQSHVDSGDHRVFLADVVKATTTGDGEPLVHIRKNGLRY